MAVRGEAYAETNTLHVFPPQGMGLRAITDALRRFGEVSHVEVLPGQKLAISAVFFDVRSAGRALAGLGERCCQAADQSGCRSVLMPGSLKMDLAKIRGISRVLPEPGDSGAYMVEFFDLRDAERARELLASQSEVSCTSGAALASSCPEATEKDLLPDTAPMRIREEASVPAYITPSKPFPSSASSSLQQASVLIRGLPKALCTTACLEASLEQAGLEDSIVRCRMRKSNACNEVLVTFSSLSAARCCMKHFGGRTWDVTGKPVTAVLAKVNIQDDSSAGKSEGTAQRSSHPAALFEEETEAPPGLLPPSERALQEAAAAVSKTELLLMAQSSKERAGSTTTDASTADGISMASDQEEVA